MRRMLRALRPDRFADLSAAVALYRPGPLGSKMTEGYIERKHGRERVEALHPSVDAVLAETYATVCYQEQTMAVIRTLSGCSLADADLIRKIMGKKKPELLAKERAKFMAGVARAGVCDAPVAERAWGVVEASSMYSFNKSHSVAYAFLAYWTAYLKVRQPVEFYSAWMTVLCGEADKSAKVAAAVYDARAHGVEVLPPCARESAAEFAPAGGAVRFGLGALRGLGAKCCASLLQERAAAPLASMVDLLRRCHATKRDLAALVGSGACDDLLRADGWTRHQALAHLGELAEWARRAKAAAPRPKPAPGPRAAPARAPRTAAARPPAAQPTLPGVAVGRPAMGPAEVLDTLVHWVAERERARARKESGAPPPWTSDPVIAAWRFCNVDRCDDRETRWIFQNVSAAHRDSPSLWFNLAVARFVNWSPTLAELGYFEEWDEGGFVQVMRRLEGEGRKVWTGAYMIPAGPPGVPKALFLARSVFTPLWESRGQKPPRGAACADWDAFLRRVPCMGDFLRNQVITDMKYTADLEAAPDWGTFALAGPGTQRGLSRLAGDPLSKKWRQADAAAALAALRAVLLERLARPGYEDLAHLSRALRDMNNLANCLCELDKYCRVVLGEGKPRSRYAPARP